MSKKENFDFIKEVKEQIRKDLRPTLYEQGFILSKPTTYIRERGGLLQEFYFRVEKSKLRPWASYRPVFDSRPIVEFGTDGIYPSHDLINPYRGYKWICLDDWSCENSARLNKNYTEKFLPDFEKLRLSIVNGILPEFNEINSLDKFITIYRTDGLIFQKKAQAYTQGCGNFYFDFISNVCSSHGVKRLSLIIKEMENWDLPKVVKEYLEESKEKKLMDCEADKIFDEYCNRIRIANKLIKNNI